MSVLIVSKVVESGTLAIGKLIFNSLNYPGSPNPNVTPVCSRMPRPYRLDRQKAAKGKLYIDFRTGNATEKEE